MTRDTKKTVEDILKLEPSIEIVAIDGEFKDKNAGLVLFIKKGVNPVDCYNNPATLLVDRYSSWDDEGDNNIVLVLSMERDIPEFISNYAVVYEKGRWLNSGVQVSSYVKKF